MDLRSVQLKHVTQVNDRSTPDPRETWQQFQRNREKADATNIDKWMEGLKEHLVPTALVPLSREEAVAILRHYEETKLGKTALTSNDKQLLHSLGKKIDQVVKENNYTAERPGFFVRLSTRSPKDATIRSEKTKRNVEQKFEELRTLWKQQGRSEELDDNTKLAVIYQEAIHSMLVQDGQEAVQLLGSSRRIWQDIEVSLDSKDFQLHVVVRKWVNINVAFEFRGFVYDRKLTAISSYNRVVFWPELVPLKNSLETRLRNKWIEIEPKVTPHLRNFIVDFAVLENDQIVIVELNPFYDFEGNATNAELFDWQKDADILTGNALFEFRILTEAPTRTYLEKHLPKAFKIWLNWLPEESWKEGIDHL